MTGGSSASRTMISNASNSQTAGHFFTIRADLETVIADIGKHQYTQRDNLKEYQPANRFTGDTVIDKKPDRKYQGSCRSRAGQALEVAFVCNTHLGIEPRQAQSGTGHKKKSG